MTRFIEWVFTDKGFTIVSSVLLTTIVLLQVALIIVWATNAQAAPEILHGATQAQRAADMAWTEESQ